MRLSPLFCCVLCCYGYRLKFYYCLYVAAQRSPLLLLWRKLFIYVTKLYTSLLQSLTTTMLTGDYQLHKHNTQLTSFIAIIGLCLFFSLLLLSLLIISPIKPNKLFFDKHGRHHRLLGGINLVWLLIGISNLIFYQPLTYIATSNNDDDININRKSINSYAIQCLTYDII